MKYSPELRALIRAALNINLVTGWASVTPEVHNAIQRKLLPASEGGSAARTPNSATYGGVAQWWEVVEADPLTDAEAHALGNALQAAGRILVELADKARDESSLAEEMAYRESSLAARVVRENVSAAGGAIDPDRAAGQRPEAEVERERERKETDAAVEFIKANARDHEEACALARQWKAGEADRAAAWRRLDEAVAAARAVVAREAPPAPNRSTDVERIVTTRKPDKGTDE